MKQVDRDAVFGKPGIKGTSCLFRHGLQMSRGLHEQVIVGGNKFGLTILGGDKNVFAHMGHLHKRGKPNHSGGPLKRMGRAHERFNVPRFKPVLLTFNQPVFQNGQVDFGFFFEKFQKYI